jgi:hypothetical protein
MPFRTVGFIPPAVRRHLRGGTFCHCDGQDYWLGPRGSEQASPASLRLIAQLEERFHAKAIGIPEPTRADSLLVDEAIYRYRCHCEHDEDGDLFRPSAPFLGKLSKRWGLRIQVRSSRSSSSITITLPNKKQTILGGEDCLPPFVC